MVAKTRNSHLFVYLAGIIVVAGILVLVVWFMRGGVTLPPDEPPARAPVKWLEARQMFVEEWTEIIGTTQPLPGASAHVTAPVDGQVVAILVGQNGKPLVEGQHVKKGDIIAQLDARLANAHRDKAKAALDEIKPHIKQAEHAVTLARLDLNRLRELHGDGSAAGSQNGTRLVSRFEMDKAQVALEEAEAKYKAAELRETTAKKELEILDEQLKQFTLAAPMDGRLGRLHVVQGESIHHGALITDIINVEESIDVLCFVPPHVAKRLNTGQEARIGGLEEKLQGGAASATGKVEFIADQAETDTGNFAVKVRFPNKGIGLRSNMTLRIRILTTPGRACLTLPESALFQDQDPPTVIVVEEYEKVMKEGKEIEVGKARTLKVKLGVRDRVLRVVEIVSVSDPENRWQGRLEDAMFVIEHGRGLRTGDLITLEVDED